MLVSELIGNAYYLSNIVARDLQTVSPSQTSDGLQMLNEIISEKSSDGRFIPYYGRETFSGVVGQEEYFVNNLVYIESLVCTGQQFRFSMQPIDRRKYWGDSRANNINSSPSPTYYTERAIDSISKIPGMKIFVYFKPSDPSYTFTLNGRFALGTFTLGDTISDSLEAFYLSYLKYKLASRLCEFYSLPFEDYKVNTLYKLERQVDDVNPIDTTIKKFSSFKRQPQGYWSNVNLGHGWTP